MPGLPGLGRKPSDQLKPSRRLVTQFLVNCGLLSCSKLELLERGLENYLLFELLGFGGSGEMRLRMQQPKQYHHHEEEIVTTVRKVEPSV